MAYTKAELTEIIDGLKEDLKTAHAARRELIATGRVQEYKLNDGQTINHMIYRTPEQMRTLIHSLQTDLNKYVSMRDGRINVARDRDAKPNYRNGII